MTSKSNAAPPAAPAPEATNGNPQNLYISVSSFNAEGRTIGERIVDMHHFGTRKWLQDHLWWATHNGHSVEINVATAEQIDNYLAAGKAALAERFNSETPASAPAASAELAAA